MAWLRIDDGFTSNAKVAQLTDSEFRVWMRLLCHCARSQDPSVDPVARREVGGLTDRKVAKFASLLLLDQVGDHHEIHDWICYQPKDRTGAERQARWRARQASKPNRRVTETVTSTVTNPSLARAQPVPSSPVVTTTAAAERLEEAGWSKDQIPPTESADFARAVAWLEHAAADPTCQSIGALSWAMFKKGGWPEAKAPTIAAGASGTRSLVPKPNFTCPECGVGFRSESAYEDHLANVHDAAVPA